MTARSAAIAGANIRVRKTTRLAASRAVTLVTAFGCIERLLFDKSHRAHRCDDHLRYPVPSPNIERRQTVVDEQNLDLTSIVRIDRPGCVENGDPVLGG